MINIIFNWLVGLGLDRIYFHLKRLYYRNNFKKVFGEDSINNFYLVYGEMEIRPDVYNAGIQWPLFKPESPGHLFRVSSVISSTTPRSMKYLFEAFKNNTGSVPKLVSDREIVNKLETSFISIGGLNNLKTCSVLESDENNFFIFENFPSGRSPGIVSKKDKNIRFCITDDYDVGFIIKIIPKSFPQKTWIAVAGLGEWGTTGAAWFLSKNWKKLPQNNSFGLIIKTKFYQDESAELLYPENLLK